MLEVVLIIGTGLGLCFAWTSLCIYVARKIFMKGYSK